MMQSFSIFLVLLVALSSLCINKASINTSTYSSSGGLTQEIMKFLSEAQKSLGKCNTELKEPVNLQNNLKYLNITVLNETTLKLGKKEYRYAVLGIWNVSLSGEKNIGGYKIIWRQPNTTTTGGQEIDFRIYKNSIVVGSFTYWYVPFQLDSYCLMIYSRYVNLTDGSSLTFIFMHMERKDLWLAMFEG